MSSFDYLIDNLTDGYWVGKQFLKVNEFILNTIRSNEDFYKSIPPFSILGQVSGLAFIPELAYSMQELPAAISYFLMESAFSINKAYNSKTHKNLNAKAIATFNGYSITRTDESVYFASVDAFNFQSYLQNEFTQAWNNLQAWNELPDVWMQRQKAEWLGKLQELLDEAIANAENAVDDAKRKAKRLARDIKRFLKKMLGVKALPINQPRFVSPIVPVVPGTPTVIGTAQVLNDIALFFLDILCGGVYSVPVEALTWVVSSVVLKYFNADGAEACRYMAGHIFRSVGEIPNLLTPTGMFAGCWMAIQSYAPYLLIAAIVTIVLLRSKQTLGEELFVIGNQGSSVTYGTAKLFDTKWEEMFAVLTQLRDQMSNEGMRVFDNMTGFAFNEKDEIVMCLDLTKNPPEHIYGKAERQAKFEPFRQLYENGPLGYP